MDDKKFMDKMEKEADYTYRNGKGWFSAKVVFEIIKWAKEASGLDKLTAEQIEKKLKFLTGYCKHRHTFDKPTKLKNGEILRYCKKCGYTDVIEDKKK